MRTAVRAPRRLLYLSLLVACKPGIDDSDTDNETDTDTSDDPIAGLDIDVHVPTAPAPHWRVSIRWATFGEGIGVGPEVAGGVAVQGTTSYTLPDVDPGDLLTTDEGDEIAPFFVLLHDDVDDDGASDGDAIVSVSPRLPVLFAGEESAWVAIELQTEGEPVIVDLEDGFTLTPLPWRDTLTFTASWRLTSETPPDRVAASSVFEGGGLLLGRPIDVAAATEAPQHFTVSGDLDAGRVQPIGGGPTPLGIETVSAWLDIDESGGLSAGNQPVADLCDGGERMSLLFVPAVHDIQSAFLFGSGGQTLGWSMVHLVEGEAPRAVTEERLAALEFSEGGCVVPTPAP